jgi:hypothetical protein
MFASLGVSNMDAASLDAACARQTHRTIYLQCRAAAPRTDPTTPLWFRSPRQFLCRYDNL